MLFPVTNIDDTFYRYNREKGIIEYIGEYNNMLYSIITQLNDIRYSDFLDYFYNDYWKPNRRVNYNTDGSFEPWSRIELDRLNSPQYYYRSVLNKQNLRFTDKSIFNMSYYEVKYRILEPDEYDTHYDLYSSTTTKVLSHPYTYFRATGAIIDIRTALPDVKRYLAKGCLPKTKTVLKRKIQRYSYNHSHGHVTYEGNYPNFVHNHKANTACKELEKELDTRIKFRRVDLYEPYCEYYDSRRSAGWKNKKHKHQWEHNMNSNCKRQKETNSAKTYWKTQYSAELEQYENIEEIS